MKARMRRHECAAAAIGLALVWVAVDLAMTKLILPELKHLLSELRK